MAVDRASTVCPSCRGTLEQIQSRGIQIDRCTHCFGLWFDAGELTLEVEVLRPLGDMEDAPPTPLPCIRCHPAKLVSINFPKTEIKVAACPICKGTFLEKGRLEELRAALRAIVGEPGKSPSGDRTAELISDIVKVQQGVLCPGCKQPFEGLTQRGLILDKCPTCKGVWYDAGELTAELGVSRKISLKESKGVDMACPRCPNRMLVQVPYPKTDIKIETCPDCRGVFLLEKTLGALKASIRVG